MKSQAGLFTPPTMNMCELLVVVFTLVMGTQVFTEAACSPGSNSTDCSPVPNSTNPEPVKPATKGSCTFKPPGACGYKQGCRERCGPKWTPEREKGYFQMKATENGHFGKFSVLESPLLDMSTTSCLRFTASFKLPVKLVVLLSGFDRTCTVFQNQPREETRPESLQLPPIGAAKILFQGFGGGDTNHALLLYNVTVNVGCCHDPEMSTVKENNANEPTRPDCNWSFSNCVSNSPEVGEDSDSSAGGIAAGVIISLLVIIAIAIGVFILWRRRNRAKCGAGPGVSTPIEDMMNDGRQRPVNQYARSESVAPLAMHQHQSEPTSYYSVIKDVPSAQKTARSENDGYAMAKDVAPQSGVKKDDDTTNPYDLADSDIDGTTNPAFVDDYNHIGAGARNKDAASSGGMRDDYNHVNTDCVRASKTNRNADEMSNEYHELERVDSDATPYTANNDGGNTPKDDYNRLGNIKGGNPAAAEGRGATPRAYDHVGLTETEGDPYDFARQDKRNQRVDPDYNRLGDI